MLEKESLQQISFDAYASVSVRVRVRVFVCESNDAIAIARTTSTIWS